MLAIVGGLAAALSFAVSTLVSARANRLVGAPVTVAGVMIVGLLIVLPVALVTPFSTGAGSLVAATLSGAGNIGGLLLAYSAYRIGTVGVVATVASTEGAISAIISVLAGQRLAAGSGPILAVVATGVALAASGGGNEIEEGRRIDRRHSLQAAGMALLAAIMFGSGLYLAGSVSNDLPIAWVLLPSRILGCLVLALPLIATRRLGITRQALPFIVVCGIVEVTGFSAFTIGATENIAVTSVLASMFAPIAAVGSFLLFGERLNRRQVGGIVLVVAGVALLGAAGAAAIGS